MKFKVYLERERDHKAEYQKYKVRYKAYHATPEQKKNRAMRNKARRDMGCQVGDGKEVDHIKPIKNGGNHDKENLRVVDFS